MWQTADCRLLSQVEINWPLHSGLGGQELSIPPEYASYSSKQAKYLGTLVFSQQANDC